MGVMKVKKGSVKDEPSDEPSGEQPTAKIESK